VVLALAKKYNVKVYTIGIGQEHEIDTALLQAIALKTGGKMFSASDEDTLKTLKPLLSVNASLHALRTCH